MNIPATELHNYNAPWNDSTELEDEIIRHVKIRRHFKTHLAIQKIKGNQDLIDHFKKKVDKYDAIIKELRNS